MAVIQISFFGLAAISELNPCFFALTGLWPSSGYNKISEERSYDDPMAPTKVKGINHYSRFFYNFNYSCGVILIPVLISIVIGVMILVQKSMDTRKKLSLAFTTFLY